MLLLYMGDGVWLWRCDMDFRAISSVADVLLKGGGRHFTLSEALCCMCISSCSGFA